ncbi:hypothetical protein JHK82_012275 [Glycine max]|nr:hypothetical protein JHK82_012275 [Glycine max]
MSITNNLTEATQTNHIDLQLTLVKVATPNPRQHSSTLKGWTNSSPFACQDYYPRHQTYSFDVGQSTSTIDNLFRSQADTCQPSTSALLQECGRLTLRSRAPQQTVKLPAGFYDITSIKRLSITRCMHFIALSHGIGNLKNLETLRLNSCAAFEEIPASTGKLLQLRFLDITGCLLGLELDLHSICRSGRKAFCIAAVGTSLPFICGILVFMGVALSITVLPVLARTLAGLKLLTTRIGEVAMAAVAFNDLWTCGLRQSLDPAIDPSRQWSHSILLQYLEQYTFLWGCVFVLKGCEVNGQNPRMKISDLLPYWFHIAEGVVCNDVDMQSLFLLTGPNGGGKSSLLRSICAAALLGICGLMVPAESALIPYFDSITLHMKSYDSPVDKKSSFQRLFKIGAKGKNEIIENNSNSIKYTSKILACQFESLLINQLFGQGFQLSNIANESEILRIEEAIAIQGNSSFEERAIVLYKESRIQVLSYRRDDK